MIYFLLFLSISYVSSSCSAVVSMLAMHSTSPATFTRSPNANGRNAFVSANIHTMSASASAKNSIVNGYAHSSSIHSPNIMPAVSIIPISISTSCTA